MSLLIHDLRSSSRKIGVYLQSLIEKLKELWSFSVHTYDYLTCQFFHLYAVLLWMINDFSAYGNLSRSSIKGYQACPICMKDKSSFRIRGKIAYMGFWLYLPDNHVWRRSKLHDGSLKRNLASCTVWTWYLGTIWFLEVFSDE